MVFLLLLVGAGVPATTALGYWLPGDKALSLCQAALGFFILVTFSRKQELGKAVGGLLLWALWLIPVSVAAVMLWPELSAAKVWKGPAYWEEMGRWIREGLGSEAQPGEFMWRQLRDLALISGASFLTGGALGLWGGTVMMGKMNFYVGKLLATSAEPWTAALYAWQPYALCRVAGYILIGASAAQPLLAQVSGTKPGRKPLLYLMLGVVLVFADLILKTWLQPVWREALKRASAL
jgi:hypothetical protein